MKLPIYLYGNLILRTKCKDINFNFPNLNNLILNMFETMYGANGIGLAAPQIGLDIKLFIIDTSYYITEKKNNKDFKKVFINPKIIQQNGNKWQFIEGCLSIPNIRKPITRMSSLILEYYDENFNKKIEFFSDIYARVIQHEYDHIHGVLFIDYLNKNEKKLLNNRLKNILNGKINVNYLVKNK